MHASFAAIRLTRAGVDHKFVDARPQWTRRASSELIVWCHVAPAERFYSAL